MMRPEQPLVPLRYMTPLLQAKTARLEWQRVYADPRHSRFDLKGRRLKT
jgi:hypothetical protein